MAALGDGNTFAKEESAAGEAIDEAVFITAPSAASVRFASLAGVEEGEGATVGKASTGFRMAGGGDIVAASDASPPAFSVGDGCVSGNALILGFEVGPNVSSEGILHGAVSATESYLDTSSGCNRFPGLLVEISTGALLGSFFTVASVAAISLSVDATKGLLCAGMLTDLTDD